MSKYFTYFDDADGLEKEAQAYETGDHISTSTGVSDASKPVITNSEGVIDSTLLPEGPAYTTDGTGVTKGDLIHFSGNGIVTKTLLTTNANTNRSIGLALETAGASSPVRSAANDKPVEGILTGATAGQTYYWDGSGHVSTPPTGSGNYVWQTGVAINATDLHTEVRFKKLQS